jgi:hypothetical protein
MNYIWMRSNWLVSNKRQFLVALTFTSFFIVRSRRSNIYSPTATSTTNSELKVSSRLDVGFMCYIHILNLFSAGRTNWSQIVLSISSARKKDI